MLVLSRKKNQGIKLSDGTEIVVHSIKGTVVRLRIDAPQSVKIVRSELTERRKSA